MLTLVLIVAQCIKGRISIEEVQFTSKRSLQITVREYSLTVYHLQQQLNSTLHNFKSTAKYIKELSRVKVGIYSMLFYVMWRQQCTFVKSIRISHTADEWPQWIWSMQGQRTVIGHNQRAAVANLIAKGCRILVLESQEEEERENKARKRALLIIGRMASDRRNYRTIVLNKPMRAQQ